VDAIHSRKHISTNHGRHHRPTVARGPQSNTAIRKHNIQLVIIIKSIYCLAVAVVTFMSIRKITLMGCHTWMVTSWNGDTADEEHQKSGDKNAHKHCAVPPHCLSAWIAMSAMHRALATKHS
jgi:hypothetical protein